MCLWWLLVGCLKLHKTFLFNIQLEVFSTSWKIWFYLASFLFIWKSQPFCDILPMREWYLANIVSKNLFSISSFHFIRKPQIKSFLFFVFDLKKNKKSRCRCAAFTSMYKNEFAERFWLVLIVYFLTLLIDQRFCRLWSLLMLKIKNNHHLYFIIPEP